MSANTSWRNMGTSTKRGFMGRRKIFSSAPVTARYSFGRATGDEAVLGIEINDEGLFCVERFCSVLCGDAWTLLGSRSGTLDFWGPVIG